LIGHQRQQEEQKEQGDWRSKAAGGKRGAKAKGEDVQDSRGSKRSRKVRETGGQDK